MRPTTVIALLALFLALGGSAVAATQLGANTVGDAQIRPGAVGKTELRNAAVTGIKVADQSLTGADINAATLAKVPHATDADTAGGHAVGCPAGTVPVITLCVETDLRPQGRLVEAIADCAVEDRRLPTLAELVALSTLNVALAKPELTGDVFFDKDVITATVLTGSTSELHPDRVAAADKVAYRCVAGRVN